MFIHIFSFLWLHFTPKTFLTYSSIAFYKSGKKLASSMSWKSLSTFNVLTPQVGPIKEAEIFYIEFFVL